MARFSSPERIIEVTWNMKLYDLPRSTNRAKIDELFNGAPPYTPAEVEENRIEVNFNDLSATKLAHDARTQYNNAFLATENFFTVKLNYGPAHKRPQWGGIITAEINRRMKRNRAYAETLRDVFRQTVLHGIGPVVWPDRQCWVPQMQMVPDILLPSRTLLSLENVEYFAVFRRYNAATLWRLTHGPRVDPGWNVPLAERCIEWAAKQWGATRSSNDFIYTPERWQEDIKADQGWYATDALPTIDAWDFWYLNDDGRNWGWSRKIVLDTPSASEAGGKELSSVKGSRTEFLYDGSRRKYAQTMGEIVHFQFADGAVVAPARYHSVRSLGFLLYSICHVQNRLRCRFTEHAFENLLQYFRVANPDDAERLTKVDLVNRGVIPDGLSFVSQQERWQANEGLVGAVLQLNRQSMDDHATSFTQQFDYSRDKREKTATQVMAEVNAASALVSAMLQDSYAYQEFQYREIGRRFCIPNSKDLDVRAFRAAVLRQGVPAEALNVDCWDVAAEKIMGGGNRQLAMAQSELVMQNFALLDPDAQRLALRNRIFAITNDAAMTKQLVPEEVTATNLSVHDAQLSAATLLAGLPMGLKQGVNHGEYAATLLDAGDARVQLIETRGGVASPEELLGLHNLFGVDMQGQPLPGNGASAHIDLLARSGTDPEAVKVLQDRLGNLLNMARAYGQRLAEQQEQQQGQNGAPAVDPAAQARAQSILMQTEAKMQAKAAQDAQKMQQRQAQFAQKMEEERLRSEQEAASRLREVQVEEAAKDLKTAAEIRRG